MKHRPISSFARGAVVATFLMALCGTAPGADAPPAKMHPNAARLGQQVVLAWNDLGMHCINPRYKDLCLLPPANTLQAVVIRRANAPQLVTTGMSLTYSFDNNTRVSGKTDFWTYAPELFGTKLPLGVGLTGSRLSGTMAVVGKRFEAKFVPILPIDDSGTWNPYQHAALRLNGVSTGAPIVVPVSDEMHCDKCHASGRIAARDINRATVEQNILVLHDRREKTDLIHGRPVLCAGCHSDNALGAAGKPGMPSLSQVMHGKHARLASPPACYHCHPGSHTQCNRSALEGMGPVGKNPRCETCHGTLRQVADTIRNGRRPWLDEPTCAQCHGKEYSTGKTLFRNAVGHGGVPCIACHNSPHAWLPSQRNDDNAQAMNLQGNSRAIGYRACYVCHTDARREDKPPHGNDD